MFVPVQFQSSGNDCAGFYKYLLEHHDGIILDCEPLYGDRTEIAKEFDLVFKFIEHDLNSEKVQWEYDFGEIICTIPKPSIFQSILTIYSHFARKALVTCYFIREQEEAIKAILGRFIELNSVELDNVLPVKASYSTLIVTEHADLHTAADILARSWTNNYVPWTIKDVLVQEKVADRFKVLLKERLVTIDPVQIRSPIIKSLLTKNIESIKNKNLESISINSANIVVGIQRNHLEDTYICVPIVTLNVFRTVKEAASLYNKINGGSATIWSENISESFELGKALNAKNFWINCNGVLDPRCVYNFGGRAYPPGLLSFPFLEKLEATPLEPAQELACKGFTASDYGTSFYEGNILYNVVVEENPSDKEQFLKGFSLAEILCANPEVLQRRFARFLLKKYKTVAIRFGQTFAN